VTAPRWFSERGDVALCGLCFRRCAIKRGEAGHCGTRIFSERGFESPLLGKFVSAASDPIEKKPLRRWRPGTFILSLGGLGCNMTCPFCQNHDIAHPPGLPPNGLPSDAAARAITPSELAGTARAASLGAVAFTYNEPSLQAEYILEASAHLKKSGIATVMVTNGMFSGEVRDELARAVDAMNIDVKTFDEKIYARLGGSLSAVMENVEALVRAGTHIEISSLIVPGVSDSRDSFSRMVSWLAGVSRDIPLHVARYFPAWTYRERATDVALIKEFCEAARGSLKYVYAGNI
jgi:pyruvate formate lyase activating enzyme